MVNSHNEKDIAKEQVVYIVISLAYALAAFLMSYSLFGREGDLYVHTMNVVETWGEKGFLTFFSGITYPGWHSVVRFFLFIGFEPIIASSLVNAVFAFTSSYVCFFVSSQIIGERKMGLIVCSGIVLSFVTAIYIPWFNPRIYMGQSSPTIWHNPTYNAVKPFALLACYVLFKMMKERKADFKQCIIYGVLTIVCLSLKPSFYQVQIPALFLYLLIDCIINRDMRYCLNLFLAITPSFLYMLIELFIMLYGSGASSDGGGIEFAFFVVPMKSSPFVPLSILLLLAFPFFALIVLRKEIFKAKSPYYYFALMLLVGFLTSNLLMETGARAYHGNFAWGYMLSVFMTWAFLLPLFFKKAFVERKISIPLAYIGMMLVALHFISGVIYYFQLVLGSALY